MPSKPQLVLVVPQLVSPLGAADRDRELEPSAQYLQRLLARGRRSALETGGFESTLCALFGLSPIDERALPAASCSYRSDTGREPSSATIVRADPIHLEAGIDELILTPAEALSIGLAEAQALASSVSDHFQDRGWQVEAPTPERWYIQLPEAMPLRTLPPSRVMGGNLRSNLPTGAHARYWAGVLNEIQMLLHDHSVNRARNAVGKPSINGMWLWGDGRIADLNPPRWSQVWANDALACALAEETGTPRSPVPRSLRDTPVPPEGHRQLVVLDQLLGSARHQDDREWVAAVEKMEREFFEPAWRMLGRAWGRVEIVPCDGQRFALSGADRYRFWRRSRPLARWVSPGPESGDD